MDFPRALSVALRRALFQLRPRRPVAPPVATAVSPGMSTGGGSAPPRPPWRLRSAGAEAEGLFGQEPVRPARRRCRGPRSPRGGFARGPCTARSPRGRGGQAQERPQTARRVKRRAGGAWGVHAGGRGGGRRRHAPGGMRCLPAATAWVPSVPRVSASPTGPPASGTPGPVQQQQLGQQQQQQQQQGGSPAQAQARRARSQSGAALHPVCVCVCVCTCMRVCLCARACAYNLERRPTGEGEAQQARRSRAEPRARACVCLCEFLF